jgi:hypothetical protein
MSEEPVEKRVEERLSASGIESSHKSRQPANLTGIFRQAPVGQNTKGAGSQPEMLPGTANDEMGFTQMFQSLDPKVSASSHAPSSFGNSQPQRASEAAAPDSTNPKSPRSDSPEDNWAPDPLPGEFTQMFQPLQPSRSTVDRHSFPVERADAPQQFSRMSGGFTQLLRTLSSEENADLPVEVSPLPAARPVPQEQGEFTRIVSRSAMREASLRAQAQRHAEGASAQTPAENASNGRPASEAVPPTGATGAAAALPFTIQPPEVHVAPPAFVAPQAAPDTFRQPQSVGSDRLQQYLPLLLIANLFLTVVALIMLAVMLARH